jgi:hypothetical protein
VQHGSVKRVAALVGLTQFVGTYPLALAGNLHVGIV